MLPDAPTAPSGRSGRGRERNAVSLRRVTISQRKKAERFLALHHGDRPLLLPNAWDAGTAKVFASMDFEAIASTSAGFAVTLGRHDGQVTLDEVLDHCRVLAGATDVPVSADFEWAFADAPADVAANVAAAKRTGLAGLSVEDATGGDDDPVHEIAYAAERVAAAAEAAHAGDVHLVLTARADNYFHGRPDLADTIARLQAYQEAGADVLYAPGITTADDIRIVVANVDRPVNVLALPGVPSVDELAAIGVARISVGAGFALVALGAVVAAARELLERGTYDWWSVAGPAREARRAFDA